MKTCNTCKKEKPLDQFPNKSKNSTEKRGRINLIQNEVNNILYIMITYKELLGSHVISEIPIEHQLHLEQLLKCVNLLRNAYGKPLRVTSGYRSREEHLQIYAAKGITDPKKIPMLSRHLFGYAVDFADPTGELYKWAEEMDDNGKLKEWGIWCEKNTKGWLHCQCVPYGSYKDGKSRFFIP